MDSFFGLTMLPLPPLCFCRPDVMRLLPLCCRRPVILSRLLAFEALVTVWALCSHGSHQQPSCQRILAMQLFQHFSSQCYLPLVPASRSSGGQTSHPHHGVVVVVTKGFPCLGPCSSSWTSPAKANWAASSVELEYQVFPPQNKRKNLKKRRKMRKKRENAEKWEELI